MKNCTIIIIQFLCTFYFYCCSNATEINVSESSSNETLSLKLRREIFKNYNKYATPFQNTNITTVTLYHYYVKYVKANEWNSSLFISVILFFNWSDLRLKWNWTDYNIPDVMVPIQEIWTPDVYLLNSVLGNETLTLTSNNLLTIAASGTTRWKVQSNINSLCDFDLYYWPFDEQRCYIELLAGKISASQIKLKVDSWSRKKAQKVEHIGLWDVTVTWDEYNKSLCVGCSEIVHSIRLNLILTRKSASYVAVTIIPISVITSLVLIQYCSSVNGNLRIIHACYTAIITTVLLVYFMQTVYSVGHNIPWIVTFYSSSLCIDIILLAKSIYISLKVKDKQKQPLPEFIRKQLQGKLGKRLLLENYAPEYYEGNNDQTETEANNSRESDLIENSTSKRSLTQKEWEIFATALDRLLFLINLSVFFLLILFYMA